MATFANRKKQIRFSAQDDINLLKEAVAQNPFTDKLKWTSVAERTVAAAKGRAFVIDGRRARERTCLLLDQFKKDDRTALKRSGTEEEYSEKMQLLQEIRDLDDDAQQSSASKEKRDEESGKEIRKRALESLSSGDLKDEADERSVKKKKASTSNSDVFRYLTEKMENEKNAKKEEVEIKKEQLKLEREKFELEKKERIQRLENEKAQTSMMLEILKQLSASHK